MRDQMSQVFCSERAPVCGTFRPTFRGTCVASSIIARRVRIGDTLLEYGTEQTSFLPSRSAADLFVADAALLFLGTAKSSRRGARPHMPLDFIAAASRRQADAVDGLLSCEACRKKKTATRTALTVAAHNGHASCVKILLAHKADVSKPASDFVKVSLYF